MLKRLTILLSLCISCTASPQEPTINTVERIYIPIPTVAIIVQNGQFGCPVDTKRFIFISKEANAVWIGCASYPDPATLRLEFEDGDVRELKIAERDA